MTQTSNLSETVTDEYSGNAGNASQAGNAPIIEIAAPDAEATAPAPRKPRLVDHLILPATPWRVAPHYEEQAGHTGRFIQNLKAELLDPRAYVLVADGVREFLQLMPLEKWDVTSDIPQCRPPGDIVLWEWRDEQGFSGALCKGVAKPTLGAAIAEFEAIQEQAFDYDVGVVLESARKALPVMASADANAPVIFLTGAALRTGKPAPDPRRPRAPLAEVRPLGSFAITLRADGRAVPGSLSLVLWDDENAGEARFHTAPLRSEIYDLITALLLMHTLLRAPEVKPLAVPAQVFQGRKNHPFAGVGLANFYEIELGTLPKKLREEGFAEQDGLKKALFYMGGKFAIPPVVWPK